MKVEEVEFKQELARLGYRRVLADKYCGISFVGGVHEVYLHDKGVLFCGDFETGEFEVGESFGKDLRNAARADALEKELKRATIVIVIADERALESLKYAASKFDVDELPDGGTCATFSVNRYTDRERGATTTDDVFAMLGDVLTLDLRKHTRDMEYPECVFCTPMECFIFADERAADAAFQARIATVQRENPQFFQ